MGHSSSYFRNPEYLELLECAVYWDCYHSDFAYQGAEVGEVGELQGSCYAEADVGTLPAENCSSSWNMSRESPCSWLFFGVPSITKSYAAKVAPVSLDLLGARLRHKRDDDDGEPRLSDQWIWMLRGGWLRVNNRTDGFSLSLFLFFLFFFSCCRCRCLSP